MFELHLPDNLQVILIEITKTCNFEFYNPEEDYVEWFGFVETESFSEAFEEADMEGNNFIIALGTMFIFVMGYPLYILMRSIARWIFGR